MEQLMAVAAFAVLGIGLVATIFGLIEFTRCFENTHEDASKEAAASGTQTPVGH